VSARTAGFNTVDTAALTEASLVFLIALMFMGGASASTAGGVRLNTVGALVAAVVATILGRREVQVFRRTIPTELVYRALALVLLAIAYVGAVSYVLAVVERTPYLPLLFETVSAFGTVGLSAGVTGRLSPLGLGLITATMVVGRLGPLTVVLLLAGRLGAPPRIHFAEEQVRLG
jgi:trk system potassium uptake protein TrkH